MQRIFMILAPFTGITAIHLRNDFWLIKIHEIIMVTDLKLPNSLMLV